MIQADESEMRSLTLIDTPRAQLAMLRSFVNVLRIHPAKLSITHKFGSDADPERDVHQPVQSAPHDDVVGWWIAFAVEIAAEFGEFDGVES